MKELTPGWKIFRMLTILQMVGVSLLGMIAAVALLWEKSILLLFETLSYGLLFWFLFFGLSVLNDHYPDIPLPSGRKKIFNRLFLVNVLLIAFLFAHVISEWRSWFAFRDLLSGRSFPVSLPGSSFYLYNMVFLFHLLFLYGMARLRSVIHRNSILKWQDPFDKDPGT